MRLHIIWLSVRENNFWGSPFEASCLFLIVAESVL